MNIIDIKISKFKEFYQTKRINEANKILVELKTKYPFDPKLIKLLNHISSVEPTEKTKNKIREEFHNSKFIKVINICGDMLNKTPYSLWLLHVIGLTFTKAKQFHDAFVAFERLLFLNPTHEGGLKGLAHLYYQTNQMKKAAEIFQKIIKNHGDDPDILNDLALALDGSQLPKDALEVIEKAIKAEPNNNTSKKIKASILKNLGNLNEAKALLNDLIKQDKNDIEATHILAQTLRDIGEYDQAEKLFRLCILSDANNTIKSKSIYTLSSFVKPHINDEIIIKALSLLDSENLDESEKSDIYFGLYNLYDKLKMFDQGFECLELANNLRKQTSVYSMQNVIKNSNDVKKYFKFYSDEIKHYKAPDDIKNQPIPIFILGMPRSGTTLVENILSQNVNVESLGELTYLDSATKENSSIREVKQFFDNVSQIYYEKLNYYHDVGTQFFIDKMPSNFRSIGVIINAFPEAKIIHMNRSPQAVCWSQYKTSFGSSGQDYSYDLDTIVDYYNMYCDMMRFWMNLYGDQIIDINYEDMVDDPASILKPVCERLGFEWKDQFLDYHKKGKLIKTASKEQANKPIYKGSSEEWQNYQSYLDKFKDLKRYNEI